VAVCILLRGVATLWLGVLAARLFFPALQNNRRKGNAMSDAITPTPAPQTPSPQPPKISKTAGCLTLVILWCVIFGIADMAGCNWTKTTTTTTQQNGSHILTKAEWRQKALPYYNPNGGGRKLTTATEFKSVMGEPSSTQTIDGYAFWYYDCADGTIQVKMIDPAMSGGTLAIETINDY
jgi:hypothetical protein